MKWIKVADRLPQQRQRVLIWHEDDWEKAEFAGGVFYIADWNGFLVEAISGVEFWAEVTSPHEAIAP